MMLIVVFILRSNEESQYTVDQAAQHIATQYDECARDRTQPLYSQQPAGSHVNRFMTKQANN